MFKDSLSQIQKEYQDLLKKKPSAESRTRKRSLEQLLSDRRKLSEDLFYAKKALNDVLVKLEEQLPGTVAEEFLASGDPQKILHKSLLASVRLSKEFNNPVFLEGLVSAIYNPKTLSLVPVGRESVHVGVNLNETAGTIQDYVNAISKTRDQVEDIKKSRSKRGNPYVPSNQGIASTFWKEIYGAAREGRPFIRRRYNRKLKKYEKRDVTEDVAKEYWYTIEARLMAAGKPAPYWELIDRGMAAIKGEGSAGRPYPTPTPTNFVNRAIRDIQKEFKSKLLEKRKLIEEDKRSLREIISALEEELKALTLKINSVAQYEQQKTKGPGDVFYEQIIKSGQPYSKEKLRRVVMALNSRRMGDIVVTSDLRVELTQAGKKRFRPSISGIIRDFGL